MSSDNSFQYVVFTSNKFGWFIRISQLILTILNLGLGAFSDSQFTVGSSIAWFLTVDVISLVYLIALGVFTFFYRRILIVGIVIIIELLLTIFWFTAFITIGATYGGVDCNSYSYYWNDNLHNKSACSATKAIIAFGIFDFLFFLVSSILLSITVVKPLAVAKISIWNTVGNTSVELNNPITSMSYTGFTTNRNDIQTVSKSPKQEFYGDDKKPISGEDSTKGNSENTTVGANSIQMV